jgi:hypothetical protein
MCVCCDPYGVGRQASTTVSHIVHQPFFDPTFNANLTPLQIIGIKEYNMAYLTTKNGDMWRVRTESVDKLLSVAEK